MQEKHYNYDDPDHKYTDKETGILRNLLGITNKEHLAAVEYQKTTERAAILREESPRIKSIEDVQYIHKQLFEGIYAWAGEFREVDMNKGRDYFFPRAKFSTAIQYLNNLITEFMKISENNKPKLSMYLAAMLDNLNHMHPFREGNGRTQRLTIELLAQEKNYDLNLNPPDNPKVYQEYMTGTIKADVKALTILIYDNMHSTKKSKTISVPQKTKPKSDDPRYE